MRTLIIAEAGVNHDGDLSRALQLVDAAADAGADVVKFQSFRADRLVTRSAEKAAYQKVTSGAHETQYAMLRRLELSDEMHRSIRARASARGIEFLSTAFDLERLNYLLELGIERIKVPSGEITNLPYLRAVARGGRKVILSTGMSELREIEAALDVLEGGGLARSDIAILHCTTEYPAPIGEVNLRAMLAIKAAFGVEVGYSDHTQGLEIPIAAVALGASVIEKHLTLDRSAPGPDHKASLEPGELTQLVSSIRNVERALGDGIKRPSPSELRNRPVARRSIVAARPISAGEFFSEYNLTVKRPGTGICPMRWDNVVGRKAARDYAADDAIEIE